MSTAPKPPTAGRAKRAHRAHERDGAVPRAERAGEDRHDRAGPARERDGPAGAGHEPIRVGAPLDLDDAIARDESGSTSAAGVTIRSAMRHWRSRQRRIGSTSSAWSSRALGDPG